MPRRVQRWLGIAALLGAFNVVAQAVRAARDLADTDYVVFAAAARLLHQGQAASLYVLQPYRAVEAELIGRVPNTPGFPNPYFNPPAAAWVLQPIAVLPAEVGLALFLAVALAALLGAAVLLLRLLPAPRPRGAAVVVALAVTVLPGALGVALAQWDPLMLLAAAAALVVLRRGHGVWAGVLLSLLLVKPHIAWLLLPVLCLAGMWRVALGFALGAAVWGATSLLIVGPAGVSDWLHALGTIRSWELARAVSVPGWLADAGAASALIFAATAVSAAAGLAVLGSGERRRALRGDPLLAVGAGLALALAVSPHAWDHDLLLLAPLVVAVLRRSLPHALAAVAVVDGLFLVSQVLPTRWPQLQALAAPVVLALAFAATRRERGGAGVAAPRRAVAVS